MIFLKTQHAVRTTNKQAMSSNSPPPLSLEAAALSGAILASLKPALRQATQTLVELQESQRVLASTIGAKRVELLESSVEWQQARAALDRLPEYMERVNRIRKVQAATVELAQKLDKGTAALAARVEEKEKERAEKRGADAADFAAVAQRN